MGRNCRRSQENDGRCLVGWSRSTKSPPSLEIWLEGHIIGLDLNPGMLKDDAGYMIPYETHVAQA